MNSHLHTICEYTLYHFDLFNLMKFFFCISLINLTFLNQNFFFNSPEQKNSFCKITKFEFDCANKSDKNLNLANLVVKERSRTLKKRNKIN